MCSIQLIDRMSRNNDLIDDKENRLQEAINYYHQHKGEKGYSIRFVADYFGVCDTTLLRRLAKKTQFRKGRPPALSNKKSQDPIRKCRECSHEFEPFGQGSMLWRSCENCPNWFCPDCCSPELEKCKYC